jgi:cyclopropane-fatty-acyl-phospholipid synthase
MGRPAVQDRSEASVNGAHRSVKDSLAVLRLLFPDGVGRDFDVEFWDGTHVAAGDGSRFTLRLLAPFALRAALTPPLDLNPGRAFVEGWIEIGGDAEAAVDALERAVQTFPKPALPLLGARLLRLPRPPAGSRTGQARLRGRVHSRRRDAAAVGFHYDQPLEFYAAFLDPRLVYSCAYFETADATLEQAQLAKIDYLLKKLRLAPGERLLDIGCGWGALVMRAAERYGARALGITLSEPQRDEAVRRIAAQGLEGRASVEVRDYRALGGLTFDKVVSVGMYEHVGRSRLAEYFKAAYGALRPGGLFLNHGISDQTPQRRGYLGGFIDRYVFPDGELIPISDGLEVAERAGFEVRDVENLREHYSLTLRHWVANLQRNAESAIAAAGERTYRIWRLYMAGSAQGFRSGRMGLVQSLLAKPHADGSLSLPLTRRDLYDEAAIS